MEPGARRGDQGAMKYLPLLLLALVWEAVVQLGLVSRDLLPSLTDVARAGWKLLREGELWQNGAASLYRGGAGLAAAIVVGAALGIAMAWWRAVDAFMGPLVEALYPMPKSALIPVTVLWLGFGDSSKILLIFLGCMLPVTLGAYNGARSCEQALVWSARSLGASRLRVLWDVVVPAALPEIANGVRTVLARMWADAASGDLWHNLGLTLYRALAGFAVAAIGGIGLGFAVAYNRAMRWLFDPLISVGFPMPKIAFLPIITLWLGFYDVSKISMVVFDAIFPVVTATLAATLAVERELLWSARNLGASERELLHEVVFPAALPQIMTGLQVALPIALIVCIVAEMKLGGVGLGGAMITASRFADSPGVFAGIVEIAIAGYVLVRLMARVRAGLLAWHPEASAPATV